MNKMKKWRKVLLCTAALACLAGNAALADGVPEEIESSPGIQFSVSGELGFSGSVLFSQPSMGYYDAMRSYEVRGWEEQFQLLWISKDYDLSMDYLISWDGKEERVSAGSIEPLYYSIYRNRNHAEGEWQENPEADRNVYYPHVPEEYQYLRDSDATVKIECILHVEDRETGQKAEKTFQVAYFYGDKAEKHTIYPEIPEGYRLARVKEKDTLWSLAKEYLGDSYRYTEIYEANRGTIKDPNLICEGQLVYVPIE